MPRPLLTSATAPREVRQAARADNHGFPRTLSFWKCINPQSLARYDMLVGFGYCPIGEMKRGNPNGVFLLTPGLFPSNGADNGGMSVTYGSGLWHWGPGDVWPNGGCDKLAGGVNLGCMRPFDVQYDPLRNANGTAALIENGTSGHPGWNLSDPLGKGTRELVAKFFAYTAKVGGLYADGWDGAFSDNWIYGVIGQSWAYGPTLDTDRDGNVDDYAVLRKRWDDGLNEVGERIRSYLPGKIVGGNGNWYATKYGYHGADPERLAEDLQPDDGGERRRPLLQRLDGRGGSRFALARVPGPRRDAPLPPLSAGRAYELW